MRPGFSVSAAPRNVVHKSIRRNKLVWVSTISSGTGGHEQQRAAGRPGLVGGRRAGRRGRRRRGERPGPAAGRRTPRRGLRCCCAPTWTPCSAPRSRTRCVRHGGRLTGPGVGDNTVAVCALSALDALLPGQLRHPVWIVATTGEEGLGNLAGVRALLDDPPGPVRAVIALEGNYLGRVNVTGVGSTRWRVTVTGPGGHAWEEAGQPSAVHEAARLITALAALARPDRPSRPGPGQPGPAQDHRERGADRGRRVGQLPGPAAPSSWSTCAAATLPRWTRCARRPGPCWTDPAVPLGVSVHAIGERPAGQLDPDHPLATLAARGAARGRDHAPADRGQHRRQRRLPARHPGADPRHHHRRAAPTPSRSGSTSTRWRPAWPPWRPRSPDWTNRSGEHGAHRSNPAGRRPARPTSRRWSPRSRRLGYDNFWLTDSSLHSRNCWAYLTLAARQTSRMTIGTAVTNPVTRHPAITAVAAATAGRDLRRPGHPGHRRGRPAAAVARLHPGPAGHPGGRPSRPSARCGAARPSRPTGPGSRCTTRTTASRPGWTSRCGCPRPARARWNWPGGSRTG